jgi:hypothetical protein
LARNPHVIEHGVGHQDRRSALIKRARTQLSDNQKNDRRSEPNARSFEKRFQELLLTY